MSYLVEQRCVLWQMATSFLTRKREPLSMLPSKVDILVKLTVVSGQLNPDWDCLQANYMLSSFNTDNLICSLTTFDRPEPQHDSYVTKVKYRIVRIQEATFYPTTRLSQISR